MAEKQAPSDPTAAFRERVSQWEKGINEIAGHAMNSDEFSRAMNKATVSSTTMQQQLAEVIGRYLTPPQLAEPLRNGEHRRAAASNRSQSTPYQRAIGKYWWGYCEFAGGSAAANQTATVG